MMLKKISLFALLILASLLSTEMSAQSSLKVANIDRNVVFGMYSGLALLMDVYYPEHPNGYGIVHISGSGWTRQLSLDAKMLNHSRHVTIEGESLLKAGYTLFSINHRAAPRFLYPAAVEDAQRAVRYIRFHAEKFRINPDKIGAVGGSSGGHLVSLLGVLDGNKNLEDDTPINRMSAKVQCVIARAAPTDFREEAIGDHFLGVRATTKVTSMEYKRRQSASPIYYVSPDDASFLLVHGDQDDIVPYHLSEQMHNKLREVDVAAKLITIEGGVHGPGIVNSPEVQQEFVRWMDQHLIGK